MIDRLTADTQARLSYAIIGGYFALKILQGVGWLSHDDGNDLKEVVMLVGFYWFQRQRPQETKPNA